MVGRDRPPPGNADLVPWAVRVDASVDPVAFVEQLPNLGWYEARELASLQFPDVALERIHVEMWSRERFEQHRSWRERCEKISRSLREHGVAKDGDRYFTTQEFAEQAGGQKP